MTAGALAWAAVQIWLASPLGLMFADMSLNEAEARSLHLAFALLLAGLLGAGARVVRLTLALAGTLAAGYIVAHYGELAARPGQATPLELGLGAAGLVLLLVAAWQLVSRALAVVCGAALLGAIAAGGSAVEVVVTQWYSTRGVFGAPLGLSTQFLLLAAVFAMLLAGSGAARHAAALVARMWRAPADRAAYVERLLAGLAAPSAAAAAAAGRTTAGSWSTRDQAAVAIVAAIASQAVPPLLGHAIEVVPGTVRGAASIMLGGAVPVAALLLVGIALLRRDRSLGSPFLDWPRARVAGWLLAAAAIGLASVGVVIGFVQAKASHGGAVSWLAAAAALLVHQLLYWQELRLAPSGTARIVVAALRSALPLLVFVWGLLVEGLDPGLVAVWAIGFMIVVTLSGAVVEAVVDRRAGAGATLSRAARTIARAVVGGVAHAVPIAIAAAAAGLLIAAASATGAPAALTAALDWTIAAGALPAALALGLLAAACGALLPTAPAYLLVSIALVPVLLDVAGRAGAAMPLAAAHLALLYGAIAGNAAPGGQLRRWFAGADPMASRAAWRPALRLLAPLIALALALPFNGDLLMLGRPGWIEPLWALAGAALGVVLLAVLLADDGRRGRARWELAVLGLAAASLLAPRLWLDPWSPSTEPVDARRLVAIAGSLPPDAGVTLIVDGADRDGAGRGRPRAVTVPLGAPGGGAERLASAGIELRQEGELVKVARVAPASWADRTGVRRGAAILTVRAPVAQPSLGVVIVPVAAVALWLLRRRPARRRVRLT